MSTDDLTEQAHGLREDIVTLAESVTALAGRTAQSERTVKRIRRITIAVAVSLALTVAVCAYLVVLNRQVQGHARCQAAVNEALIERTRLLTEVTADERAAERRRDDALDAVLSDPVLSKPASERTPAERQRVLDLYAEYLTARKALVVERAKADRARAENPVPSPPSAVCGP